MARVRGGARRAARPRGRGGVAGATGAQSPIAEGEGEGEANMSATTKPTLRTTREQIEARVRSGTMKDVPDAWDALDDRDARMRQIDASPLWSQSEKARQRREVERAAELKIDAAIPAAKKAANATRDERIG